MSPGPVFIVGPARSGTELIKSMLNRHPDVHIADETHYFDDLRPRVAGARPFTPEGRQKATAYFATLADGLYGFSVVRAAGPAAERQWGEAATADELFAAFCRARAAEHGKAIWGEKTPRHVFRGAEILSAFPDARLIATVRDPRAVVASYRDWRKRQTDAQGRDAEAVRREARRIRASYSITFSSMLWAAAVQAAERLHARFGPERVRLLRYEALVSDPESVLRDLCAWLDIGYAPAMAEAYVVNSTYLPERMAGVQASAADRWRQRLSTEEIGYIQWLTGRIARRHGYQLCEADLPATFVAGQLLAAPVQGARAVFANRRRVGALPQFVVSRLRGYLHRAG